MSYNLQADRSPFPSSHTSGHRLEVEREVIIISSRVPLFWTMRHLFHFVQKDKDKLMPEIGFRWKGRFVSSSPHGSCISPHVFSVRDYDSMQRHKWENVDAVKGIRKPYTCIHSGPIGLWRIYQWRRHIGHGNLSISGIKASLLEVCLVQLACCSSTLSCDNKYIWDLPL